MTHIKQSNAKAIKLEFAPSENVTFFGGMALTSYLIMGLLTGLVAMAIDVLAHTIGRRTIDTLRRPRAHLPKQTSIKNNLPETFRTIARAAAMLLPANRAMLAPHKITDPKPKTLSKFIK